MLADKPRVVKNVNHPTRMLPAKVEQGNSNTLLSCFSSPTVNKCPFYDLFSVFTFLSFLACCCLQWPLHSAEVLSSVHKCGLPSAGPSVTCLTENIWTLDKLCSGTSYSAISLEFKVT